MKWWRRAANQEDNSAQVSLGWMYQSGEGVLKDYVLVYKWYNLAAAQENKQTPKFRGNLVKLMTPSQIAEAQRLAREFKPKKENLRSNSTDQPKGEN